MNSTDPHHEDRAQLGRSMAALGLTDDDTTVAGKQEFKDLWDQYENRLVALAGGFQRSVDEELRTQLIGLVRAIGAPREATADAEERSRALLLELEEATSRYVECLRSLLSEASALPEGEQMLGSTLAAAWERLMAAEEAIAGSVHELDAGNVEAALIRVTAARLPVDGAWVRSREYTHARLITATGLRDDLGAKRDELRRWVATALEEIDRCLKATAEAVEAAARRYGHERELLWAELKRAADSTKQEVAHALIESRESVDAGLPVRAAVALSVVDDLAAAQLAHAAEELLPESSGLLKAKTVEEHANQLEKVFTNLERNSIAWAGASALVPEAVDPTGASALAWSHTMASLSGIPEHLARASTDAAAFAHSAAFPGDVGAGITAFVNHTLNNITPNFTHAVQPGDNLLAGFYHVVTAGQGSLAGQAILHDGSMASAFGHYMLGGVQDGAKTFVHHAAQSPQIHDALGQLATSGHLAGTAALQGIVGHVPIFTVVISTCREVRTYHKHDTSLADAVENVLVDVAGVTAGVTAGLTAGGLAGLHGLAR